MSDSETDPDLTVERYDLEDDLNAYGSPVHVPTLIDAVGDQQAGPSNILAERPPGRTEFCSCKNTCSKGSGRKKRGCPCRDEGIRYAEQCKCGTKKAGCKNKDSTASGKTGPSNSNTGRNAFERHNIALEEAKQQIAEFIGTLNENQKDNVLLELLSNGKGSLDYAKNIIKFGGAIPTLPPTHRPWCTCGVCCPMPSEEENKCCGKIRCLTSFITFQNTGTDVLIMAIRGRCE